MVVQKIKHYAAAVWRYFRRLIVCRIQVTTAGSAAANLFLKKKYALSAGKENIYLAAIFHYGITETNL